MQLKKLTIEVPEIMTVQDVADYLKVNPETVRRLRRRGELKSTGVGSLARFYANDVQDYLNQKAS